MKATSLATLVIHAVLSMGVLAQDVSASNTPSSAEKDAALELKDALRRAQAGDSRAQSWLGQHYAESDPPNFAQAIAWYSKSAAKGDQSAKFALARMQEIGRGVPVQITTALASYQQLAAQGNADAQFRLGMMYEFGAGVPGNPAIAACYYDLARKGGSIAAAARTDIAPAVPPGIALSCDIVLKNVLSDNVAAAHLPPPPPPPPPAQGAPIRPCSSAARIGSWLVEPFSAIADREHFTQADLVAKITVGSSGTLDNVEITKSSVSSRALKELVESAMYAMDCQAIGRQYTVSYPLQFAVDEHALAASQSAAPTQSKPAVLLVIKAGGALEVDHQALPAEDAQYALIKKLVADAPERQFVLQVADGQRYEPIGRAIVKLKRAGAAGVLFALGESQVSISFRGSPIPTIYGGRVVPKHLIDIDSNSSILLNNVPVADVSALRAALAPKSPAGYAGIISLRPNKASDFNVFADVLKALAPLSDRYSLGIIGDEQFM